MEASIIHGGAFLEAAALFCFLVYLATLGFELGTLCSSNSAVPLDPLPQFSLL
jgi:hypothetical protein